MPYQPSEEEIRAAKNMMDAGQSIGSHFREQGAEEKEVWFDWVGTQRLKIDGSNIVFEGFDEATKRDVKESLSPEEAISRIEWREEKIKDQIADLKIKIDQLNLFKKRIESIKEGKEKKEN